MSPLSALVLACTLRPSPAESSSVLLGTQLLHELESFGVSGEVVRVVDHGVRFGVSTDEGDGDGWPAIRQKMLDADILVIATPIWLGQPSSVCKMVLERLDAEIGETDDQGRMLTFGKVAAVAVVGNEDGAHHRSRSASRPSTTRASPWPPTAAPTGWARRCRRPTTRTSTPAPRRPRRRPGRWPPTPSTSPSCWPRRRTPPPDRSGSGRSGSGRAPPPPPHAAGRPVGVAVLLLAGCREEDPRQGSDPDPEQVDAVERPELGACRRLTPRDVAAASNATSTVDCAEPHTAQTYAVGQLPAALDDAPYDDPTVGEFAYDTCSERYLRYLGADESLAMRTILSWAWFRPSPQAWEDGARWYRCDLVGGGDQSKAYVELPEDARGLLLKATDRWLVCVQGPSVTGSVKIPCSQPHDWRAVSTIKLGEKSTRYPGDRRRAGPHPRLLLDLGRRHPRLPGRLRLRLAIRN